MFNEDKAFKLFLNGEIHGVCRVIVQHGTKFQRGPVYLCVFTDKQTRRDADLMKALLWELKINCHKSPTLSRRKIYLVVHSEVDENYAPVVFATPASNGSLVPGEAWF